MAKPETVFAWEPLSDALASGLEDLIAFNWDQVQQDPDWPPLDIDWPKYLMYERVGIYKAVSARKDGRLIGYNSYYIQPLTRHKSTMFAVNDALYVDADHRGGLTGLKLLDRSEDLLRALGVQFVLQDDMEPHNSTTAKPRATFGKLLSRRGYKMVGTMHAKRL